MEGAEAEEETKVVELKEAPRCRENRGALFPELLEALRGGEVKGMAEREGSSPPGRAPAEAGIAVMEELLRDEVGEVGSPSSETPSPRAGVEGSQALDRPLGPCPAPSSPPGPEEEL